MEKVKESPNADKIDYERYVVRKTLSEYWRAVMNFLRTTFNYVKSVDDQYVWKRFDLLCKVPLKQQTNRHPGIPKSLKFKVSVEVIRTAVRLKKWWRRTNDRRTVQKRR